MSTPAPNAADLEKALGRLGEIAERVRRAGDRETWRFAFAGRTYFLHFFDRRGPNAARRIGSNAAASEFSSLKRLQDAKIPAVRAAALLSGFRFGDRVGDAVLVYGLSDAVRLGDALQSHRLAGRRPETFADRRQIVEQLATLLHQLGQAGLGHEKLSLNTFLLDNDRVLFADADGVTSGGLRTEQLWRLARDAGPLASASERLRVYSRLVPDGVVPRVDKRQAKHLAATLRSGTVHKIRLGEWTGHVAEDSRVAEPWNTVRPSEFAGGGLFETTWPALLERLTADQLHVIKRDASGDVLATTLAAGRPIDVIVKRPRNKFWYRYLVDAFRRSRGRRIFDKTQLLRAMRLPVETPLFLAERRVGGYVAESVVVFERVTGDTLEKIDLDALSTRHRAGLFFACGRILRLIEAGGYSHTDAKSSNWIVHRLPDGRPIPVMVDAYGIRRLTASNQLAGIQRLLRAMRNHPQYTPDDSLNLCKGFAPRTDPEAARED